MREELGGAVDVVSSWLILAATTCAEGCFPLGWSLLGVAAGGAELRPRAAVELQWTGFAPRWVLTPSQ